MALRFSSAHPIDLSLEKVKEEKDTQKSINTSNFGQRKEREKKKNFTSINLRVTLVKLVAAGVVDEKGTMRERERESAPATLSNRRKVHNGTCESVVHERLADAVYYSGILGPLLTETTCEAFS